MRKRCRNRKLISLNGDMGLEKKEEIYKSIRLNIISHRFKPGQAIREKELAEEYEVSRTPIREILRRLESEGLVTIQPYKGVFVTEVNTKDVEEILDIRLALEGLAVRLAAIRVTEEDFVRFSEIDKLLDRTLQSEDVEVSFEADKRLHRLILEVANNRRVENIITNLLAQIHRMRYISGYTPGRVSQTANEHKQIIQAILAKEPHLAEERMRVHLEETKKLLLESARVEERLEKISTL